MPLFSIIMPCFNPGPLAAEAIRSLQRQTCPDWELVAVDDGSSDGSFRILEDWARADPRIRAVRLAQNGGAARARNIGLSLAGGDYLCFLDADDVLTDRALEAFAGLVADRPVDLAKGGMAVTHAAADPVPETVGQAWAAPRAEDARGRILPLSDFTTHAYRRGFVEDCRIRFEEGLTVGEDRMFLARAQLWCADFAATDRVVYVYRKQHSVTMEAAWDDGKRRSTIALLTGMRALIDGRPNAARLRAAFFLNSFPWQCRLLARTARIAPRPAIDEHARALRDAAVAGVEAESEHARRFTGHWTAFARDMRRLLQEEAWDDAVWRLSAHAAREAAKPGRAA
ncbi:glycosyltransferase family 2 protein [Rhodovulum sp. DZ06]|uniref:glycosyltransferase family 2 protein n=1 Tax=Rhodovulum sp. DZ06 TaxID=3425126 RepID=UPI003D3429EC